MKSMIINTNKISIDFKDTDYAKGLGVSVQNATEGSVSHVGIEFTRDCAVQKDMESSIVYTDANKRRDSIVSEVAENLSVEEFDPADFISKSMTGKDAEEIEGDGMTLDEYVAGSLERAIERVKSQRRENETAVENQVEEQEEEREYFEEMERRVMEASQMAAGIQGISEAAVRYFIENDRHFSPESIHNSRAVAGANTYAADPGAFEEMKAQVEAVIENSGMEVEEETVETARWLYENKLPVTGENIRTCETLRELEDTSPEILYERIVDQVLDGVTPEGADLTVPSRREVSDHVRLLKQTDEGTLRRIYRTEADFITAKRQMEEIRLTMTIDAARTMESKGIRLDPTNLMEIVEELRAMEQEAAQKLLVDAGLPTDEQTTDVAAGTLLAAKEILQAPVMVFGKTIETAAQDTIADVAAAGNELRSQLQAAAESYETVGTEVRRDLGDSIHKAFSNVKDILQDLGMPETAANQRAVRILAYNRMELTPENIQAMKEYDDKVTSLAKGLKPEVVTELIRRKENPLEMNLDELSEKVSEISDEIATEDISFRKYLWKLEHSGSVTAEERKSMIGIYRLLDKVEKSDGAVIGEVIKDGRELSFSSLLSAVRSRKARGMDATVDDEFGGLKEVVTKGESISEQIGAAFGENVVAKLQKELSPLVLQKNKDTYMEKPLEVLLDECQNEEEAVKENARYYEERAAEIREIAAGSDEQLLNWLKELEIPDSMVHIQLMKSYLEHGAGEFLKLYTKKESEKIIDAFEHPEELEEVYEELDEVHEKQLQDKKEKEDVHYDEIKDIARMASSISFYHQVRQFQRYEVPIVTERGVTACTVTVRQGREAEKGTVEISVDSQKFGGVQATFKVSGSRVTGFVTSEEEEALEASKEIIQTFEKDLEMNGFTMERGDMAKGSRSSFHVGNKADEAPANDRLYLVAKLFIQNVQRKEEEK